MKKFSIQDNSILVIPSNIKLKVLRELEKSSFVSVKIMTLSEFQKKYYFDYDERAIFFLMEKYHYQYEVAKMYLSHLLEVEKEDFGSLKIRRIITIKEELDRQGLLLYTPTFSSFLDHKTIYFYGCDPFPNMTKKMIEELQTKYQVQIIDESIDNYCPDGVYQLDTIEEEVVYVAGRICELANKGIPYCKIKLCGVGGEYVDIIKRIFQWYHLPITFQDNCLYATKIGQDFLKHLDKNGKTTLDYLKDHYFLENPQNLEIYNQLIQLLNQYLWIDDFRKVKSFLESDLKKITLKEPHDEEEITMISSLKEASNDDYVFLLGFNQGEIPKVYKDEDYFNDDLKQKLGLETTSELNSRSYTKWLKELTTTKNLVITTKKASSLGICYLSSLNDDLQLDLKTANISYQYSNLYNQLQLGEKIDTFIKYGEKDKDLETLYSTYPNLPYATFQSQYQQIDPKKLKKFLNYQFTLSYSSMNSYYQCGFRYYLANILKLNIYEETFYTVLGNVFHYILSIAFTNDIDIPKYYHDYLEKCSYVFNAREKFFLQYLEKELEFIINTIKNQMETSSLNNLLLEEKVAIDKSREEMNITFKGFIDKIMFNDQKDILAIIDYKTGNPDLNLNHIIYGLDLQLPIYLYLAHQKFPNATIAGFYLQKILNNEISKEEKNTYEERKADKLKLQGYSNSDTTILEQLDSSYYESKMIKGMRTTSKGLASKKVLTTEQMDKLEEIAEDKIEEAITNILNANFEINPKRIGMDNLGCKYCNFKDICFFKEEDIKNLKEYKNMEFLGSDNDDTEETC